MLRRRGDATVILDGKQDYKILLNEKVGVGAFMKGILGYNGNPSLVEVIAYGLFLGSTLVYFFWHPRVSVRPEAS